MTREELLVERITYITKIALGEELNNMLGIEVNKDFNEAILQASIKAAKVGMKFADEHPRWTSVEDELPPRWETNPNVSVPVITFGTIGESIPFVELQRYDFGGSKWQYGDATHWMPFQFPKKGGEE